MLVTCVLGNERFNTLKQFFVSSSKNRIRKRKKEWPLQRALRQHKRNNVVFDKTVIKLFTILKKIYFTQYEPQKPAESSHLFWQKNFAKNTLHYK